MGRQQQRRQQQRRQQRQRQAKQQGGTTQPRRPSGRRQQQGRRSEMRNIIVAAVVAVVVVIGIIVLANRASGSGSPSATATPTPSVSLASVVDGIKCGQMESLAYHIHQHLALYDHGKQVNVPSEIGIPGGEASATCFYWIHVHASTQNIIHVESPIHKTFTLGNFFDIWKSTKASAQPSGDAFVLKLQRAAVAGQVHAYLNGKRWAGSYRTIPLKDHGVITVEIGSPVVPPKPFTAWNGL